MIRLTIIDHSSWSCRRFSVSVNPLSILLVKDGRTDICGTQYVDVIFTRELMEALPKSSSLYVAVAGTYEEVLSVIANGKKDAN